MPFYITFFGSFKSFQEIFMNVFGLPEVWTFDNYVNVVDRIDFVTAFRNSLIITVFSVIGVVLISSMAAYRIARVNIRMHKVLYFAFVASMVVPFPAIMLPLVSTISTLGLFNTHVGVILSYLGLGTAFATVLYCGFLKTIPMEIEEAAAVDGCSTPRIYLSIVMPMLKPTTATIVVLNTIWFWNDFLLPAILLTRGHMRTIPLAISFLFDQFHSRWDLAMAAVIMCIIPVIIVFLVFQKYIVTGIAAGAVKG
jgi:raffinose/stachyose/melibiose transport system permease protein